VVFDHDPAANDDCRDIGAHRAFDKGLGNVEIRVDPRVACHSVEIDEDRVALHAGQQCADLARKTRRLGAVQCCDFQRLIGTERRCCQLEAVEAMHLVHHPQLHDRVFVIVDGFVVEPIATFTPAARNGMTGVMPFRMWKLQLGWLVTETCRRPISSISPSVT